MTSFVALKGSQLLQLAVNGEWETLEQTLKALNTAEPEISKVDENVGLSLLMIAAQASRPTIVRRLLELNVRTEEKSKESGDTALHICCRQRDREIAGLLLGSGANIDSQNDEGQTPLHIAAWKGDLAMIMLFNQRFKANPHITDKLDRHPLHIAAECGHSNVIKMLTEQFEFNLLERTKDGNTLLHIASEAGDIQSVLLLLQKGVPLHMPNKVGAVCLHTAAEFGHTGIVKILLQHVQVDTTTRDGLTALHIAAENCKPQIVQTLLGFGAQVQHRGGKALETPLLIAARVKEGEKVAEILLKSGAEVNTENENGETAAHVAARHGNLEMMKALAEEGADLTWRSKVEETPLHVAVRYCHAHMVDSILNHLTSKRSREAAESCVRQENKEGETSLHLAAEIKKDIVHKDNEDVHIVKILMEYKADVTAPTKQTKESPIHYCAKVGNVAVLQEMLDNVPSDDLETAINKLNKISRSPLILAAEQGHADMVKLLLKNNARVNMFDEEGKSALHLAAEQNRKDIADILLFNKAFVNAKTKLALTPLHLSAQNGSHNLIQPLIKIYQACTDALSLSKQTPLHLATINGQLEVCNSLLNLGADITATDIQDQTPLHLAAENDHSDIVKLFLSHKPELVTLANKDGATCIDIAAAKGSVAVMRELLSHIDVTTLDNKHNGSSPLHLAAAGGHAEVVKVLLQAGASATEEDSEGMTALHLAAQKGHVHIMDVLKASVSLEHCSAKTGLTALHVAAFYGQEEFVREILSDVPATIRSAVPDPTMKHQIFTESEYTPLHLAALSGHENLVRLLLNTPGVQADAKTSSECFTPLHLAAQSGHIAVVGLLLSNDSSLIDKHDKHESTCLHLASAHGHVDIVRTLLCHGADINQKDMMGCTALHHAAKAGCLEVARFLVESGASVQDVCDKFKQTPLQYAAQENHLSTVSFLLKQPNNNIQHLLKSRKFVLDLMICGTKNKNIALDELVLHSAAPLATAVSLSNALSLASLKEKVHSVDLQAAAEYCEVMGSDLLKLASTAKDLDAGMVLRAVDHRGVSMLDCLIEGRQKDVVAISDVQMYLTNVWYGNLQWASWEILLMFFCLLIFFPLWPVIYFTCKQRFNIPVVKFMSHLVSHFFLLALFILTVVYPVNLPSKSPLIPTWFEWFLLMWMAGMLLAEVHQTAKRIGLAWIRVLLLILSAVAIFCHLLAVCVQLQHQHTLNSLFARHVILAFAMILGFIQLLEFLMIHHMIGPWATSIKNQMKDLVRFAIIMLLFLIAFSLTFTGICEPVRLAALQQNSSVNDISENHNKSQNPNGVSLFFALFGLTELKDMQCQDNSLARVYGLDEFIFGVYMVVTVIVLLNMLIAMLNNTYDRIYEHSDKEWKFGRAILIRDMSYKTETPAPFNLFVDLILYAMSQWKKRVERQDLSGEDEEAKGFSETHSLSMTASTSVCCFKRCRMTQIPSAGYRTGMSRCDGKLVKIARVTDWSVVVQRFRYQRGQTNGSSPE